MSELNQQHSPEQGSVVALSDSFNDLVDAPSREAASAHYDVWREFMSSHANTHDAAPGRRSILISPIGSMIMAAVLPPKAMLSHRQRRELLEVTATSVNRLRGSSGRQEVRRSLRAVERFCFKAATFKPVSLYIDGAAVEFDLAAYDRAKEFRLRQTSQLDHKSFGELTVERFDNVVSLVMPARMDGLLESFISLQTPHNLDT